MPAKAAQTVPETLAPEEERPGWWDFDVDGSVADGIFLRAGQGFTRLGVKRPFLELDIDGATRSVWLHHKAAVSKVRERVEQYGPIREGERVVVERVPEKRTSADGFEYFPYRLTFPDLPQASQEDIFGVDKTETADKETAGTEAPVAEPSDDDIPFQPV